MSISLISIGAYVTGFNVTLTPVAGTYSVGDALIYSTGEQFGSNNISTPAGWTLLSDDVSAQQVKVFGRFAGSTSETIPSVTWSSTARSWAQVTVFRGIDSSFTTTKSGSGERSSNQTTNIIGPAAGRTPTQDNSLLFWAGNRNKTATTDGTVYSAPTGWTIASQISPNGGTQISSALAYWIQTTATIVPANSSLNGSLSESVNQAFQSTMVFLAPAPPPSGGGGTGTVLFPPPKRKIYVFIDNYYPR